MRLAKGAVRAVILTYELECSEVTGNSDCYTAHVTGVYGHTMRQKLVGVCRTLGRLTGDTYVFEDGDTDGTHTYIHFKKVQSV